MANLSLLSGMSLVETPYVKVVIGDEITYESKEFGNYLVLTNALKRENRYCEWLEDSFQK